MKMELHLFDLQLHLHLDAFDLQLDWRTKRRVVGLFGPSGSGKTTILEAVAGLRGKARGHIRVSGHTLMDSGRRIHLRPENRHIGYVPQDHLLFPHLNVRENINFGKSRARGTPTRIRDMRREVISVLGLEALMDRPVAMLSGGERQRVALARALCSGPRLLLLDEPLASLDAGLRKRILPYLLTIRDNFNLPMLVVSHNPVELLALCDEVVAIDAGRMVARGSPVEVFTDNKVYQSTMDAGFENMLPVRVASHAGHYTSLALGDDPDGPCIRIPRTNVEEGQRVMVGIPAREIMVAREAVDGISARNRLMGVIDSIRRIRETEVVTVRLPEAADRKLVVELTSDAVEELGLRPQSPTCLLFKSTSVILYA